LSAAPEKTHQEEARKLLRGAGVFGLLTAASRVLGLARDMAVVWVLSAAARDAFLFAFNLPMLFRNIFGEGALTNSFVPLYVERIEKQDRQGANRLASLVCTALTGLLGAVAVLGALGCLAVGLLPGTGPKDALILRLLAIMAPFLPLVCLYAFFLAVLTSHRRFAVPGGAPILLNLAILAGAYLAWRRYGPGAAGGVVILAGAVLAGGALQLLVELPSAWRAGVRIRPAVDLQEPGFRAVLVSMAPLLIGTGAFQLNTFLNRLFALKLVPGNGPQSWLACSNLLVMAPIGVVAVALSTAALPALSSLHARDDRKGFAATLTGALRMSLFMLIPVSAVLIVAAEPIVKLLYGRGGWQAEETPRMVQVLFWSALSLPATVVTMLAARAFYAMKLPRVPARIAVITVVTNVVLSLLLVRSEGVCERVLAGTRLAESLGGPAVAAQWLSGAAGLALATTLAGVLQMILMLGALKRQRPELKLSGAGFTAFRAVAMCVPTGVAVYWVAKSLPPAGEGFIIVAQRGIAPVLAGIFAYTLVASLLDTDEYRECWRAIRGRKRKGQDQAKGKQDQDDEDDDEEEE